MVNGKKEEIPPFPHHKAYIYRCKQFFLAKRLTTHLTMGNFVTLKELYNGFKNKSSIPRVLLVDPTSDCNLKCKGCWSQDYESGHNISYKKFDDILDQAENLGIMDCLMTGGEPLLRKEDILKLCKKHDKMTFGAFTNATLIDEEFADEMAKLGNLNVFISIEGTKEENDFRRGAGVYDKAIRSMDILKSREIAFAFSACYHSKNYKTIASDEFLDYMREKGAWFGWLFQYIPVGSTADTSLVCTAEQRAYVQEKIRDYCVKHDYVIIDFWNNGHLAFGCLAAGIGFVHINAKGDVEPCAFCHYSDSNIHEVSLAEALRSKFFTAFRAAQPFSQNPLRPCPLIDNPQAIIDVVNEGDARSTHLSNPESPEDLAKKSFERAEEWGEKADELFKKMPEHNQKNFPKFLKYLAFKKGITDGRRKKV
ncbi:radical SAM protein [Methanococcoides burtonii]|uniref:Radical SAM family protein n=1 Tax=Methanococcoides burtonii (strain DSM 6242 / NBRC 107633 / OCM 468 / ACE-M) TaxID=259564 RepID=Q12ZE5_METBU|nr:radical SAM protein [Methanococcoides burtonii]ABE51094.1 Radical SAM family protein [Methanococcoides burtonii DSM 6242]ABE51181.1 Radical SAM family protein [Methanococcoides burtonii DSM 6242]